jgi:hypothetical protein
VGWVYVFFGGAAMDATADLRFSGSLSLEDFGSSLASAGDMNGDGAADFAVGSPQGSAGPGRVAVYWGGAALDTIADVQLTGATANDYFGASVAMAGDINGDGYSDIVVGAYYNDAGGTNAGRAYVYFGGARPDAVPDMFFTGSRSSELMGLAVAPAGDMNGDGLEDLLVSAHGNNINGSFSGRAMLYYNSMGGPDVPDLSFTGTTESGFLGCAVAGGGDINGDGKDDLLLGAYASGTTATGQAFVHLGGSQLGATSATLAGGWANDEFGRSVAVVGDMNGDGYDDMVVGARYNDMVGTDAGRAYIYLGGASIDSTADLALSVVGATAFGHAVARAGDVNGDGFADLIVGGLSSGIGRAWIFYGSKTLDSTADLVLNGETPADLFGASVSGAGDVNGDGYDDLVIGAEAHAAGGSAAGRAYLYFGSSAMDTVADIVVTGTSDNDHLGLSIASAGDVNGDGYADVLFGAPSADVGGVEQSGRAYLLYGGPAMDGTVDLVLTGGATGESFGIAVASAGDMNLDGFDDMVLGAQSHDAGGLDAGRAYVFFGGGDPDADPDIVMTGGHAGDQFGNALAAGDVNGDGRSDVVVGAFQEDGGAANMGRAHLFISSAPAVVPRITAAKDVPNDQGGKVKLEWTRSGFDLRGVAKITSYVVERSEPPGPRGFAWEVIATLPARQITRYAYTATTIYDSVATSVGTLLYRVTAVASSTNGSWVSMPVAVHSVDNLAPATPSGPSIAWLEGGPLRVAWRPNTTDPDLAAYVVYRSLTGGFTPSPATRIASTSDTCFVDSSTVVGQSYYYRVTSRDVHGNESLPTSELRETALAVELVSFAASVPVRNIVRLEWRTAAEIGNARFEIERRDAGGHQWSLAGSVDGAGTTSVSRVYRWEDPSRPSGTYYYRLRQISTNGHSANSWEVEVTVGVPMNFGLHQNFPNPFNPTTRIEYELAASAVVRMTVYDQLGRTVVVLVDDLQPAGYHHVDLDAKGLAAGLYFCRFEAGLFTAIRKMVLIK